MNPKKLLRMKDALPILDSFESEPSSDLSVSKIPRILYQYWDSSPPEQVLVLLDRNRQLCELNGISYRLFTDVLARDFLRDNCSRNILEAYEIAPHPAMKSDVFRVAILAAYGGFYLDADMVLRDSFVELYAIPGDLAVFRWESHNRRNICSWLVGSAPASLPITFLRDAMAHSISWACLRDPNAALIHSLAVAGPGVMTKGVASFLKYGRQEGYSKRANITIRSVEYAYQHYLQNGPNYLKSRLAYKETGLHWLVASKNEATQ